MPQRSLPPLFPIFLSWTTTAEASQYRGADWGLLMLFYMLPYVGVLLLLTGALYALKLFRISAIYYVFTVVVGLILAYFALLAHDAPGSWEAGAIVLGAVVFVGGATLVPAYIQNERSQPKPPTPEADTSPPT
jgi:hypothetical protein